MNKPRSAYDKAGGMTYFPRMLDKIRLFGDDQLHPDFHANLGKGADGWCCDFLRVAYPDLRVRVLAGGTDEQVLEWCFTTGRSLNEGDLAIWNSHVTKLGWNDEATPILNRRKAESGLANRDDIVTMVEYFEVDEGRKK
jgi:Domain of unknown function (DUF5069)